MTDHAIHLDLDRVNNIAHTGIRRAALFMGLGLNAARRKDFTDYQLSKLPMFEGQTNLPMDFFPNDLPIERIDTFKEEFAQWITACGLREIIEHFALFLDHIHKYALITHAAKGKLSKLNPDKAQSDFNLRFGVPKKLDVLEERFQLIFADAQSVSSLYEARNCLTHNLGVVAERRCTIEGKFAISWRTIEVIAKGSETGIEWPITQFMHRPTTEQMEILARTVLRDRRYAAGEKVIFSQQDLWEICYFFGSHAIPSTLQTFVCWLEANGVRTVRL